MEYRKGETAGNRVAAGADRGADTDVGRECHEPDCGTHDFLPFWCPACEHYYCLQHRSRFAHRCSYPDISTDQYNSRQNDDVKTGGSVKEIFTAVENRFDADPVVNTTFNRETHFRVATTEERASFSTAMSTTTKNQVNKLDKLSADNSKSQASRRIADKTKQSLLARTAKGDDGILQENRLYICIRLPRASDVLLAGGSMGSTTPDNAPDDVRAETVFVSKHQTLGESLQYLATSFPRMFFGRPSKPADVAVAIFTEDSPDWRCWDRNILVQNCLRNFETVTACVVPLAAVVDAQTAIQHRQEMLAKTEKQQETAASSPSAASPVKNQRQLEKGEICLYKTSTGEDELVTVVCPHLDDFPNVYYTIRLHMQDNRERQTDGSRLQPIDSAAPSAAVPQSMASPSQAPIPGSFKITIASGGDNHPIPNLLPSTTVFQVKLMISQLLHVPASAQKLIFKGKVLADKQTLGRAHITDNAKVLLMSSASKTKHGAGCMSV